MSRLACAACGAEDQIATVVLPAGPNAATEALPGLVERVTFRLAVCSGLVYGVNLLGRRFASRTADQMGPRWHGVLTPLALILVTVGLLIQGAYKLGFPAYSVLAGLGVGGLAVALAARDSLAKLLGSMLIMIEKPFRVGHYVRLSGTEGTIEDVGFRSTRIRTLDNSLISIPNNAVVNATRSRRRTGPIRCSG
jgi:small-conductance mechanosensitive channel